MERNLSRLLTLACASAVLPAWVQAQDAVTVTGRVTSEAGAPLPAASVFIQSLNLGTVTREDGTYSFTVPAARATGQTVTLTARLVGYRPTTAQITLSGATVTQNFALGASPLRLTEVVVTGAGTTTTRERVGAVINSVDSTVLRRATQPQNVVSALAGTTPNVDVRTQSGEPGASASIKIRGASSVLGTNQPLFVVDNQPIDNTTISSNQGPTDFYGSGGTVAQNRAADINPNDIESIEILKGAAAAAIYGARAANGVVLITTKRGRAGQTRYSLSSTSTFDKVDPTIDMQDRWGQGNGGTAATCAGFNCRPSSRAFGAEIAAGAPRYNHLEEIFDTGLTLDNNLSVSGGSDRTTFYLSGGLTNQDGYMVGPNNRYNRATVRLKGNHQLFRQLNVGGNFSFVDSRGAYVQKGSNTSGLLLGALRTPPDFNNRQFLDTLTGLHRSYRFPRPGFNSTTAGRGYDNPFFVLNNSGNRSELGRFIGNINLDWNPLSFLRVQYTLGGDSYADQRYEALPLTSSGLPTGQVTRFDVAQLQIDHNLVATATQEFSPSFTGRLVAGQNLNSRRYRQRWVQGNQLNAPAPLNLQNTLSIQTPQEFRSLIHIDGYFAQAEADLWNQLFLSARVRNDGYSSFGASSQRATYPAIQASWIFTNFLGNTEQRGLLSYGKLRANYGEVGREPPVYATAFGLTPSNVFGSGFSDFLNTSQSGQGGLTTSFIGGNPDLKPERNRETEVGFDLGMFNQRADLGFTYYSKRSSDVILQVPVNASETGFLQQYGNAAVITNKGVEATFNLRAIQTPAFTWEIGLQYGRNRGRVESLAEGVEFVSYNSEGFTGSIGSSTVGYAPGVIRGLDFARCGRGLKIDLNGDNTAEDIDALCGAGAKKDALYLDESGQPVEDPTDRVIADPNPDWTGGLNTTITLGRRLRLSGLLDTRQGFQVWNGTRAALYNFGTHKDTEIRTQPGTFGRGGNWYTNEDVAGPGAGKVAFNSVADWEAWWSGQGGSFGNVMSQFIEDGSFVKLRELSVAYSFDQPWLRSRLGFSNVDIRLAGRNLLTWTDYKGLDPEANLGGAEYLTQGMDFFNNPQSRSFVLSFTLNR